MSYCPKCKRDIPGKNSFCEVCGGKLMAKSDFEPGDVHCPSCGAQVKSGWRFCEVCAYDLQPALAASQASASPSPSCPHCGNRSRDGMTFCERCGKPLHAQEVSQTTKGISSGVREARVPPAQPSIVTTQPGSTDIPLVSREIETGIECRKCGAHIRSGLKFCEACRTPVSGLVEEPSSARRRRHLIIAAIAVAVLITLIAGGAIYWYVSGATERKLEDAIAKGNLLKPPGENAYELYHQLKRAGTSAKTLARFEERLLPMLTSRPQQLLADFAVPGNKEPPFTEWEEAQKLLAWAMEMKPNDSSLAAKSNYCTGRIAYLSNRKDEALQSWKRASDQDTSWALATNGVGLIYNELKDYATARQFLLEAIRREPGWAVPYNNAGTSFFYERDYSQAENYYRQAVERAQSWGRPHFWLGDIAMHNQTYSLAVQEYEAGLNLTQPGATNLDLDKIREKLDQARQKAAQQVSIGD
jgi:tetratricopeptide (TPR) repeat protein/predicted amidophosphoribosyltransferase